MKYVSCRRSLVTAAVAATLAFGLAACAWNNPSSLAPGDAQDTVESRLGRPAEIARQPDGSSVWFYPGGRLGRETWAVRMGPDGRVLGVEQRLTRDNIARIAPDSSNIRQVRDLLGPPYRDVYYPVTRLHTAEYPMQPGSMDQWMILWVDYDDTGTVRKVTYTVDPERNAYSTDSGDRP